MMIVSVIIGIYATIALALLILSVFGSIAQCDDDDKMLPCTVLMSILWPLAIVMFLIIKIDQKWWDDYDKNEGGQPNIKKDDCNE